MYIPIDVNLRIILQKTLEVSLNFSYAQLIMRIVYLVLSPRYSLFSPLMITTKFPNIIEGTCIGRADSTTLAAHVETRTTQISYQHNYVLHM